MTCPELFGYCRNVDHHRQASLAPNEDGRILMEKVIYCHNGTPVTLCDGERQVEAVIEYDYAASAYVAVPA